MKRNLWLSKIGWIVASLLIAVLVISACGEPEPAVVGDVPADAVVVDETDTDIVDETVVEETDAEIVEETDAEVEAVVDVEVETEETAATESETETDTMVETETITDVETIAVVTTTDVVTETDVITETEVITEQDVEVHGEEAVIEETDIVAEEETDVMVEEEVDVMDTQMTGIAGAEGALIRGFTLLDYDFVNLDGEVTGEIEDMLVDVSTGDILFASIEYGGFLDIGDTEIVVPLQAFSWGVGDELILNFDELALDNFPDLGSDWPDITDPTWDDDVNAFWTDLGMGSEVDFDADMSAGVMWLSDMTTYGMTDMGLGAGVINDVLVDMGASRIKYVLFNYGTVAPADASYIVPYDALDVNTFFGDALAFDENIDLDTLELAPRFDRTLYPDNQILDPTFSRDIDTYWMDRGYTFD